MVGETHAQLPFMTGHAQVEPAALRLPHRRPALRLRPVLPAQSAARHRRARHRAARQQPGARRRHAAGRHRRARRRTGIRAAAAPSAERCLAQTRWRRSLTRTAPRRDPRPPRAAAPFAAGLFAASEMFVDQLLELYRAGILRRRVYDCLALERLLAAGAISERFDAGILAALTAAGVGPTPRRRGVRRAQALRGVPRGRRSSTAGSVRAHGGEWIAGRPRRRADAAMRLARRVPRARAEERPGAARRLLPRPARLLRGAARAARERSRAVRHARRSLRQPAVRAGPGAARAAAPLRRAASTPP